MNKKAFIAQTIGIILFYLLGWFFILCMKAKETFEESRIIKDMIKEYKGATDSYKEFYENDFDVNKINDSRIEKHLKEMDILNES